MRPKQWAKNMIVLAPLLFSGSFSKPHLVVAACLCVVAFCLISSSVYTINDIVDAEADKVHPKKKNRPIPSGEISIGLAIALCAFLMLAGLGCAFAVRPSLVAICLVYVGINLLYSFKLKHFPMIDVLCIASGFVLRAVAGAVAIYVAASGWFLMCTTFGALFIGLEKRRHELNNLSGDSTAHRKVLGEYSSALLDRLEGIVAPCLLTTYSFYCFKSEEHGQWMMITIPIVLYGVMRYQYLSEKGEVTGSPEDLLFKDLPIQITLILWVLACALVVYGNPTEWMQSLGTTLDSLRIVR
jgi:4-hydroxybenzoate polyprenyltransferase